MGSPGKVDTPEQLTQLTSVANNLLRQSGPARRELLRQTMEALTTGGVGAQIPLVQRAVDASNSATSNALAGEEASLARVGLGGTPFAESILAGVRSEGAARSAAIPTDISSRLIAGAPGLTTALAGVGTNALGNAAQLDYMVQRFNDEQFVKFMQDLKSSLQTTGAAAGGGGYGGGGGSTASTAAAAATVDYGAYA